MRAWPTPSAGLLRGLALGAVWLVASTAAAALIFFGSSRTVVVASHETVLRPTLSRQVVLHTGPLLPDLRLPSRAPVGADLTLGKTEVGTVQELAQRYALIASQPDGQVLELRSAMRDLAVDAALRGSLAGLLPVAGWLLLGTARRRELGPRVRSRRGVVLLVGLTGLVVVAFRPWADSERVSGAASEWTSLEAFTGVDLDLPAELDDVQVRTDGTTTLSRRLVRGAVETYLDSKTWYAAATEEAAKLSLHQPGSDETVVVLVSDRHDNIGMDPVARAVADSAGATAVFTAGDDTSSGEPWEAFSLDSLTAAFDDLARFSVAGNHDHGAFVSDYLAERGWVHLVGESVPGPGGSTLWGIDDPRSSGLGNWLDQPGMSFADHEQAVADAVCAADDRVSTVLVHDAATGREALARGCADLVVGGHLHVRRGPLRITGANGEVGYSYTTGTTGGAAYAIAVGSKPRRTAEVSLITYRDGRPVGLQSVALDTLGRFTVGRYVTLAYPG